MKYRICIFMTHLAMLSTASLAADQCAGISSGDCKSPCAWEQGACRPGRFVYTRPLGPGDSGVAVKALQKELNSRGIPVGIDGDFGKATSDAVKAFQQSEGLSITGTVDQDTGKLLAKREFRF